MIDLLSGGNVETEGRGGRKKKKKKKKKEFFSKREKNENEIFIFFAGAQKTKGHGGYVLCWAKQCTLRQPLNACVLKHPCVYY